MIGLKILDSDWTKITTNPLQHKKLKRLTTSLSHSLQTTMASIKVTLDATLLAVMSDYTSKVIDDAILRLADKYGFDYADAKQFILSGGVVVKYPPLERDKLPWTGDIRQECCKAIKKNGGLFTQCNGIVHTNDWCKPCSKEVAKKGKPNCGTVQDRLDTDILEYQVGPFKVKPYADYMKKHAIQREQVDKACDDYGITIDPRQFELKKRPRKPRNMASAIDPTAPSFDDFDDDAMTAASFVSEAEQLESDDEDDYLPPEAVPTVTNPLTNPLPEPIQAIPTPLPEAEPTVTNPLPEAVPTPEPIQAIPTPQPIATEPKVGELQPEPIQTVLQAEIQAAVKATVQATAPVANIASEQISTMDKATVQAHCKARGISIEAKGLVQLKRELSASLRT